MGRAGAAVRSVVGRDRREPPAIGRRARLDLAFERRGNRTELAQAYAEPPFRAGRGFDEHGGLHLIMTSSAPGVFGGDVLEQYVRVGRGCRVRLTSQSATQAHPGGDAPARIVTRYFVDEEASLRCEWEPLIPFAAARVEQRVHVELARSASLLWSDAQMCGRQGSGERWAFASLAHELRVTRAGALEYLERYALEPARQSPEARWTAADAAYLGTVIASGVPVGQDEVDSLHRELARRPGLNAAADRLGSALLLVRLLARDGTAFHDARRFIHGSTLASAGMVHPRRGTFA